MRLFTIIPIILTTFLLTGCMYPSENLSKNRIPNDVQLEQVQAAIDRYVDNNQGRLPIRTKPNDTPIYQKYIIDFSPLKQQSLLADIPGTAFENGGVYQYVLINPEDNPTVKLIDLRTAEKVRSVSNRVNVYRSDNSYPPFGEEIEDGIYKINHKKIGLDASPFVVSPYSKKHLPIVMDINGDIYIDYRIDLFDALNQYDHGFKNGEDIRSILTEHYPFVPAYSLPYTIEDNEPVFMLDK